MRTTSSAHRRQILVIDDASAVPVHLDYPDVQLLRNDVSLGTCRSRRLGASAAKGDVLVVMDAHMQFSPGWLEQMLRHVDSGSLLCAAWWNYELSRPLCWGADFVWCGERDYAAGRVPGFAFRHRTKFPGDDAVEVPMLIGACYMMLRDSYEKLGGYSPFFRTWGRLEQDLSIRAWLLGLGVKCVPSAHVGHFSRSKFPYPVRWDDIEFNQAISVRTAFEEPTARLFAELLEPLPAQVRTWLDETDFAAWRRAVQSRREMADAEFLDRFVPAVPEELRIAATQTAR